MASALTTIRASTASSIRVMARMPTIATQPAAGPSSARIMSPSERASRRVDRNRMTKSCTAPAKITPTRIHRVPGR